MGEGWGVVVADRLFASLFFVEVGVDCWVWPNLTRPNSVFPFFKKKNQGVAADANSFHLKQLELIWDWMELLMSDEGMAMHDFFPFLSNARGKVNRWCSTLDHK